MSGVHPGKYDFMIQKDEWRPPFRVKSFKLAVIKGGGRMGRGGRDRRIEGAVEEPQRMGVDVLVGRGEHNFE